MNWEIKIANAAVKNLKRFPAKDRDKIKSVLLISEGEQARPIDL